MAKKAEIRTKDKLNKLESVIGSLSIKEKKQEKQKSSKEKNATFKTSEVVILLLITMFVSLIMGSLMTYKLFPISGQRLDDELQEFIKNYEYIVNNYNGKIDKEELIDTALSAMLQKLDRNSTYIDEKDSKNFNTILEGSYQGLGVQVYDDDNNNIVIYGVFENSPAQKAGLKAGDIITKIDGKSTKTMKSADLANEVKKSNKNIISITYLRGDKEKTAKVKIGNVNIKSVASELYQEDNKKIGYIAIGIFANNSYDQFKKQLDKLEKKDIDALIIDVRGNSGGYLSASEQIISLFLDSKHVIYQIQKNDQTVKHYSKGKQTKKYKIIVLIDGNSASASEVVASALHEQYGAVLIGTKSYGKGTVQEMQNLNNGDKYKLTTKNWLTSKGQWINNKGLEPDVEVPLNEKYFDEPNVDNDNQFQKALDKAKE